MTNVTLSIEAEDLKQARVIALQHGTSLNAVIREFVKAYVGNNSHYQDITRRIIQQANNSRFNSGGRNWVRDDLYERAVAHGCTAYEPKDGVVAQSLPRT